MISYFSDLVHARNFAELMCLPHIHHHENIHHHEKKNKHSASGSNISKLASSNNLQDLNRKG